MHASCVVAWACSLTEKVFDSEYWPNARAMIRLGDKYQAHQILALGDGRLSSRLPADIDAWDALYNDRDRSPAFNSAEAVSMANLARFRGNPDFHARALYLCAQLSTEDLLEGYSSADGRQEYLCQEDLGIAIDAREDLQDNKVLMFKYSPSSEPRTPHVSCHFDAAALREERYLDDDDWIIHHNPLRDPSWAQERCGDYNLCYGCSEIHINLWKTKRQSILERLTRTMERNGG